MKSAPLTVSYICHLQSSLGSALAIAHVIPPCAETVCDLVGKTLDTTAVFKPDLASSRDALIPEPPPPTIKASNSIFLILLVKILFILFIIKYHHIL